MACDPIYWGSVTTTIEYKGEFQTYTKTGGSSNKGGAYVDVYPNFGSVVRVKSEGKLIDGNGNVRNLLTGWQY